MNNQNVNPPKFAQWLFGHFFTSNEKLTIYGDIEEYFYEIADQEGSFKARLWFWKQIITSFPVLIKNSIYWRIVMFKNYLKIAFRNIKKFKGYSFINITSLAIGMACCILLLLWVRDDLSFDTFHENAEEIGRIVGVMQKADESITASTAPAPLGPKLKDDFPEIMEYARYFGIKGFWPVKYNNETYMGTKIGITDPAFLEIFTFPFILGNKSEALNDKNTIIVTASFADKIFGAMSPIGKVIEVNRNEYTINGVINDIPENSHLQFECLLPFKIVESIQPMVSWQRPAYVTFIKVQSGSSFGEISTKIKNYPDKFIPEFNMQLSIQPLKNIHLYSSDIKMDSSHAITSDVKYVYMLTFMAILILAIACINFINLTTAKSSHRFKEVGVRKVIGANNRNIFKQFFTESMILSFMALFFALIIAWLLLPAFNTISNKHLELSGHFDILIGLIVIAIGVGTFSGIYPAFYLSSLKPVFIIKGFLKPGTDNRSVLRKGFVFVQFCLSICFIICTWVIHNQINFMLNKDLGYDRKNIVILGADGGFSTNFETHKNELLQHPNVLSVARGFQPIWDQIRTTTPDWEGRYPNKEIAMQYYLACYDYFETYNMEFIEGRSFSKDFFTDSSNYILNEAAITAMGIESPIGKEFTVDGVKGNIIGIVKNFHHNSLHNPIRPIIFQMGDAAGFAVKIGSADIPGTMKYIEKIWSEAVSHKYPFEYHFLDSKVEEFYQAEYKISQIFDYATVFAIFISCLGLLGLAAFTAERRTKEIGVRKVFGASVSGIVLMLSKEYTKWIVIANIFAWPVAYFAMNQWLQNFSYRISIGIWTFFLAALLALTVALITISFQAFKAALANPVDALKFIIRIQLVRNLRSGCSIIAFPQMKSSPSTVI